MKHMTLDERIADAELNPSDHRNSREYREVFEAVRDLEGMDERHQLVDYACEILGINDDSRYVYQWMADTHANFGGLCHEIELTAMEKLFWRVHDLLGRHIISRLDKVERDDEFRKWLGAAHKYITQEPSVKKLYVRSFYDYIAPRIVNQMKG